VRDQRERGVDGAGGDDLIEQSFGVRGVGEASIVPPTGAVANAIYRATGVRMSQLPISPPRLLKAMMSK